MAYFKYIIIGAGMTADSAVQGIREVDPEGSICLISIEQDPPYDRPPLSKGLWKDMKEEEIWRNTGHQKNVTIKLLTRVMKIIPEKKEIHTLNNEVHQYDKLLIATGGIVNHLSDDKALILYYRTIQDYHILKEAIKHKKNIGIIGGGFIGAELAASLIIHKKKVSMIFPEIGIGSLIFPEKLATFLKTFYENKGVKIFSGESVLKIQKSGDSILLQTTKQELKFDLVIAGIGIKPNIELAIDAGLKVDNGIIVDEYCRSSNLDIFAAGDVANFFNPAVDHRIRVEHEDNANHMGVVAGKNLAGEFIKYDYLPMFYSDLFEFSYEAIGELNPKFDIFFDWETEFEKGIVYYSQERRIKGIILLNISGQIDTARKIINDKILLDPINYKGLISFKSKEPDEKVELVQ